MVTGLRGLKSRLLEIREYLEAVVAGRLPVNHDIMRNLQVPGWLLYALHPWMLCRFLLVTCWADIGDKAVPIPAE